MLHTGWLAPDTCVAEDCRVKQPLLSAELSPDLLLVLIHSSASGKAVRDAVRQTWVSSLTNERNTPIQYRYPFWYNAMCTGLGLFIRPCVSNVGICLCIGLAYTNTG